VIKRILQVPFKEAVSTNRIVLVQGPRNVGKRDFVEANIPSENYLWIDCEENRNANVILSSIAGSNEIDYLVCEHAHLLEDLQDLMLQALEGSIKQTIVVICSFKPLIDPELFEALQMEGLVFDFFSPTFYETAQHFGMEKEGQLLEERLIYGTYPSVTEDLEHAELTLRELVQDVIITHFGPKDRVNKGDKLLRVMQLLAFRIGEPVTNNDIGERVGLDNETVERYIDLLSDAFIVFKLPSFHSEKRYELKKSFCVYFWDNGIRNALIRNFNPSFLRDDINELWRNYVIVERLKWLRLNQINSEVFFWRTHTRQQLDLLELKGDTITAYKTDWEKRKKVKFPKLFAKYYPNAKMTVLNKNTYLTTLSKK
jgi:predicted AAA+ superfamily ATPase